MSSEIPSELLYTREHEWVRVEGEVATVGITQFASEQLGDITMVELPQEGATFAKDDVLGSVESVKAVSDVFAPLSGTVARVNTTLTENPQHINEEPYEEGWLVQVRLSDPAEKEDLMSAEEYTAFLRESEEAE